MLVVDDKQEPENWDTRISNDNVIGFNAPKFTMAGLNQNMELVQEKGDIFFLSLKEFIKNILANERYRLFIKQLVENHHIPFWNTLSEDGEIAKTRIVPQENYWH